LVFGQESQRDRTWLSFPREAPSLALPGPATRSVVSLVRGEERRRNVYESLMAIEDQILPVLKTRKYVIIKPNIVSTVNQLACTHADALRGIMDFVARGSKAR